jgi:hypothetical protein
VPVLLEVLLLRETLEALLKKRRNQRRKKKLTLVEELTCLELEVAVGITKQRMHAIKNKHS